ncbi:DUF3426 domain-containing protein [Thiorhodospira sibirica]|uniref:DUF3426 domain-containing protein n=1 Tax=Thiorhodospira sibirica TaxID=154347 RepID=UPI00022C33BD|nr:DUF3426 domain-containing protein [Thiorhodospira sibirica]
MPPSSTPPTADALTVPLALQEDLLRSATQARRGHAHRWGIGCLLLLGVLLAQFGYYQQPTWLADVSLGSPQASETSLVLVGITIYTHPSAPQALIVMGSLENRGSKTVPLPSLTLSFSNQRGQELARRTFAKHDYLAQNQSVKTHIGATEIIDITFELIDPGPDAIGYQMRITGH